MRTTIGTLAIRHSISASAAMQVGDPCAAWSVSPITGRSREKDQADGMKVIAHKHVGVNTRAIIFNKGFG